MGSFRKSRQAAAAVVAVGALTAGLTFSTAGPASASTIKKGWVQLCAQGDYSAVVNSSSLISSRIVTPGTCDWWEWGARGWEQLTVIDIRSGRAVGSAWYNGAQSGIGLGAKGTTGGSQWIITW
ncbi:hypothetical protein Vqi01_23580 [Micromonospora qiuiae]|uniref:Uncharacterized protein n=1 Tax=Micromonospora qiuiae TaxID=502268 RepID=A0ABQ4JAK0_9ACTN|nr:hypothetical protein [Micromonospora qiuiae]GIJ27196.1 hypothetical protein Vqi01_23580 [Micromonospora qiuiae]